MTPAHPHRLPSARSWERAEPGARAPWPVPAAYAVVFVDDAGSPTSVVATFPGPMSAQMYGQIAGGEFRVVRMDPARHTPRSSPGR